MPESGNDGMGFAYGMATLKTPYVQIASKRSGWRLVGIASSYYREWRRGW